MEPVLLMLLVIGFVALWAKVPKMGAVVAGLILLGGALLALYAACDQVLGTGYL